nr:MAG TPA: hypothetical protein [Caudoviricetes sp.]
MYVRVIGCLNPKAFSRYGYCSWVRSAEPTSNAWGFCGVVSIS